MTDKTTKNLEARLAQLEKRVEMLYQLCMSNRSLIIQNGYAAVEDYYAAKDGGAK